MEDKSQIQHILHSRCDAIADSWHEAITQSSSITCVGKDVRQQFVELTEQIIPLLLAEPFDHDQAQAIGASLAQLGCVQPEALGMTQQVLTQRIAENLSTEQLVVLQPRMAALFGELAVGFFWHARQTIQVEQDQIQAARISQSNQVEMNEHRAHLEEQVEARTIELISAIRFLEQEITERRRVEKALRERERFLSDVFVSIQDGITVLDSDFTIVRVNPTIERWYAHEIPLVGKKCYKVFQGGDEICDVCPSRRTIETGQAASEVVSKRDVNGKIDGWLDLYSFPLYDTAAGQIRGVIEYARDITERKRAEEALRQAEEQMRLLIESADDIVYFQDLDGRLSMLNAAGARVTGYAPQEFEENPQLWRDIAHPEDQKTIQEFLADHPEGASSSELEYRLQTKDGEWRWMQSRMVGVRDASGRYLGYNCIDRDITEIKRAQETLRKHNRELALLDRASQALTSTLDLDRVLSTILEEVRRLLGIAACSVWLIEPETGELVCRQATGPQSEIVRGWRLAPGDGIAGWVVRSRQGLIVPDTRFDERHFKNVDEQIGMELRSILSVPLRVKQGIIGVIQVLDTNVNRFDVKDQKLLDALAASAAIAVDNARLVETLRQRTAELEARNEDLDAFAHTVAHDLKNPLGLIVGFSEALREEYAAMKDQELQHYLDKMSLSGRKMSNIIDELLLLAGVRQQEVEIEPLDMASIVNEARQRLIHIVEERQAEVILPEAWPVALGYGPWVEEVWVNYLSNAVKYGGHPPRVELGATLQPDGMVRFWVSDNGIGLSIEEQGRLFTPFTRFDQIRTKGHGLGLSIVRRIVEKLGGEVGVESEKGEGSVFSFILPATDV